MPLQLLQPTASNRRVSAQLLQVLRQICQLVFDQLSVVWQSSCICLLGHLLAEQLSVREDDTPCKCRGDLSQSRLVSTRDFKLVGFGHQTGDNRCIVNGKG